MELEILEKDKNKIRFKISGEDDTFCNLLRKELWEDKDTEIAGYNMGHSLKNEVVFVFHSKKDVLKALNIAIENIKKKNKEFLNAFNEGFS
ncbi:DNA-directed RNA polymerase subunit L [Candidatus Woesearchaeota archaeon]|nr:DNA-directed RNA polymerase subunit L [Candidatus Woesearchaeota archaeon]